MSKKKSPYHKIPASTLKNKLLLRSRPDISFRYLAAIGITMPEVQVMGPAGLGNLNDLGRRGRRRCVISPNRPDDPKKSESEYGAL